MDGSGRGMYGWRGFHQNGGGLLLDWGIHLLDQLLDLIDSPVISVDAHILSLCTPEADDNARVLLRYENGVSALCEVTSGCFLPTPRWLVQCEHGTVRIDAIDGPGVMMKADTTDERRSLPSIVYMPEGPVTREMTLPMSEAVSVPLPEVNSCWADFYHNIARAIEGLEPARVTPEQAMRVLKVVELAFESERQQRAISCRI